MIQTKPSAYTCDYSGSAGGEISANYNHIFRNDPPNRIRRVSMAAPMFKEAETDERKREIARTYNLSFEFLEQLTKDYR